MPRITLFDRLPIKIGAHVAILITHAPCIAEIENVITRCYHFHFITSLPYQLMNTYCLLWKKPQMIHSLRQNNTGSRTCRSTLIQHLFGPKTIGRNRIQGFLLRFITTVQCNTYCHDSHLNRFVIYLVMGDTFTRLLVEL
jgi:hypothetical protein